MERKTKINAPAGKHDLVITREFELPVELLFRAYEEAEIIEQWMGTKVEKLESKTHGSYRFVTTDPMGNKHGFNGTIHEFSRNKRIVRTFEMESGSFGVTLEFLEFESLTDDTSKLNMHVIYRSGDLRDQNLKLPFSYGVNMAHDRLEEVVKKLK